MVDALRGGATVSQIMARFGASRQQVDRLLVARIGRQQRDRLVAANHRAAGAASAAKRRDIHHWTDADEDLVRRLYLQVPATQIARQLGVSVHKVRARARRLGVSQSRAWDEHRMAEVIRRLNPQGYPDAEIARIEGADRHAVSRLRRQLRLPFQGNSDRRRRAIARKTAEQCDRAGVASLGALRAKIYMDRSRAMGWPADLPWRAGQILTLLWENGPMTRKQIVLALRPELGPDLTARRMDKALMDNDVHHGGRHPNSYLATLARRGLIIRLPRALQRTDLPQGQRQGRNVDLYTLPLTVERRIPDAG